MRTQRHGQGATGQVQYLLCLSKAVVASLLDRVLLKLLQDRAIATTSPGGKMLARNEGRSLVASHPALMLMFRLPRAHDH